MTQVIPRDEAKAAGFRRYFTGVPCRNTHVSERLVANGECVECRKASAYRRKDRHNASTRAYKVRNPDKARKWNREWKRRNPEYGRAARALERARLISATPPWVDTLALRRIYKECPQGHHVDHVVPIKHASVCGLHVPWNLQYLPAEVNIRKKNRFELAA